ncbi:MAG: hypothetical protein KGQ77_03735, partial [Betaproteobacteria bacterium]|nr:hypothetical protein [Betaproteobacteria bacterium]
AFQKTDVITPRASPTARGGAAGGAAGNETDFFAPTEHINPATVMSTTYAPNQALAVEVQELSHDPVLEEAAIHFANAEYAEAEAALQAAVAATGSAHRSAETWRALFDLYRAIGAQAKFESLGLDFVSLFETSAPNWFSLADVASSATAAAQPAASAPAQGGYTCQPHIDAWAANQLSQFVETRLLSHAPLMLDFERLQTIGHDAAEPLTRCLMSLNKSSAKVAITRAGHLADACAALTPPGDPGVPQGVWLLRLEVLRLLGRNEEFENAALDYCVTYEVSPPAWQRSGVSINFADQSAPAANWDLAAIDEPTLKLEPISQQPGAGGASPLPDPRVSAPPSGVLSGEITAGMKVVTPELLQAARSNPVTISCATLKRVDFASAGTLLNWVLELQGEGRQVHFLDTHRLIAAFFNVIGISGHARVSLRRD